MFFYAWVISERIDLTGKSGSDKVDENKKRHLHHIRKLLINRYISKENNYEQQYK
jgi:hypothetical protein